MPCFQMGQVDCKAFYVVIIDDDSYSGIWNSWCIRTISKEGFKEILLKRFENNLGCSQKNYKQ